MAREQHEFKLGPAILQASGAEPAPDTFRAAVLRALDSKSTASFAQTSKGTLDLVLSEWPGDARLTIRVRPASAEWPEQVQTRLHRARQQLIRRGNQRTLLRLVQKSAIGADDSALQAVVSALGAGHTWPHLHLSLQFQHLSPQLLACVGASFPGLRSLSIGSLFDGAGEVTFPPPAAFPSLQHLTIRRVTRASQAALWPSLAPYMPQLVSFTIDSQKLGTLPGLQEPGSLMFGSRVSHTLKHLTLPFALQPPLATLLQQHALSLETVTVQSVDNAGLTGQELPVCSWRTVVVKPEREARGLMAGQLGWMPVPAEGKLVLDLSACTELVFVLPLTDTIVAKLASLDIQGCKTIRVQTSGAEGGWFFDVDPNDQPQALRHALAQLRPHIQTRGNELVLWGFTMSPELAAELTAVTAAAQWGRVSLQSDKVAGRFRPDRAAATAAHARH